MGLKKPFSTFTKLNIRKWLLVHLKINALPQIHISERYLGALTDWGIQYDGKGLDYFIPSGASTDISALPAGYHDNYILIAAGGLHNTKQMPEKLMADVCRLLGMPVVIAGSKGGL